MRFLKVLWYFVSGQFAKMSSAWEGNKHVVAATYDAAIAAGEQSFEDAKKAVAALMSLRDEHAAEIQREKAKLDEDLRIQDAAKAKAQHLVQGMKTSGKTQEEISNSPELQKHQSVYNAKSATIADSRKRLEMLESKLNDPKNGYNVRVEGAKTRLQMLQNQTKELANKKQSDLIDLASAEQSQLADDMMSGITMPGINKDLQRVQKAVAQKVNSAKISSEIARTDSATSDREYLNFLETSNSNSDFMNAIGLGSEEEKVKAIEEPTTLNPAQIPE